MNIIPWNPWREWDQLRRQTDQLWDRFLAKLNAAESAEQPIAFLPDTDIVETANEYRLYLSVPGLLEEDIDILVEAQTITVRGERHPPYDTEHARRRAGEWRYGLFHRQFQFAEPIGRQQVQAFCEAGVLTILVPKSKRLTD